MKMVKGLLLGTAAGIVAVSGAQAADLPVKARAVEYVKVCSIYGAGFYYIPGTDTCIKLGGYVRVDYAFNGAANNSPANNAQNGRNNRETSAYNVRTRAVLTWDARTQTEYGTLRAYVSAGHELNTTDGNYRGICYFDRAFIQFAGFTFGKAGSFFGFYRNSLDYTTLQGGGQFDAGVNLLAYTAQFAGGFSATLSLEDNTHHRAGIWNAASDILTISAFPGGGQGTAGIATQSPGRYAGRVFPDIVGNLRVDQPWGSASLSGVVRDVSGGYIGNNQANGSAGLSKIGYAIQGGVKFNLPWAKGDEFWVQGTWARGAAEYLGFNPFVHTGGQWAQYNGGPGAAGSTVGLAWAMDGIYGNVGNPAAGLALTEGWSVLAAVQHYWTPNFRTSVFGQYTRLNFGNSATVGTAGFNFCNGLAGAPAAGQVGPSALTTCNPDFAIMQVGVRNTWSPVANLDIGVEVLYTRLDQNMVGTWNLGASGNRPAGAYVAADQDTVTGLLRVQRNFWP